MRNKIFFGSLILCLLFVSCAPRTTTSAPTTISTSKAVPSATLPLTVTPKLVTYLPGLSAKVPEPDLIFIQQMVNENYLTVMGLTRDQVALSYKEQTGIDGQTYVVMVDDTTGVPLAVFTQGQWQRATLKFFGMQVGITIGSSGFPSDRLPINDENTTNAFMDSSRMTVGSDWQADEPSKGVIDPSAMKYYEKDMVQYAESKLEISDFIFHPIICPRPGSIPSWLLEGNFTKDELREIMRSRIEYVIKNTPEASFYVVVNEPYQSDNPERAQDPFYKAWGNYEYIKEAFQIARDTADAMGRKNVKLIFNDGDNHYAIGSTSQISRKIVVMLHESGLIDYLGMQVHISEWEDGAFDNLMVPQMPQEIAYYKKMGVPIIFTELTYSPSEKELSLSSEDLNKRLSHVFSTVFQIAIDSGNVEGITYWGPTDPQDLQNIHDIQQFIFYDDVNQPRQSYYEVLKVLYDNAK